MEGGPPSFGPRFTGTDLLRNAIGRPWDFAYGTIALCGARFHALRLPRDFVTAAGPVMARNKRPTTPTAQRMTAYTRQVWALPFSLATTQGVEVSFLSSGYLDVSVPRLASLCPMYSGRSTRALPRVGFPIRKSRDQRLVSISPGLIAAAHVLHRLLAPRHPPCALVLLISKNTLCCRYGVFKVHAGRRPALQRTTATHAFNKH